MVAGNLHVSMAGVFAGRGVTARQSGRAILDMFEVERDSRVQQGRPPEMSRVAIHGRKARVTQRSLRVFLATVGASEESIGFVLGRASRFPLTPWHLRANPWSLPSGSPGPDTHLDRALATRQRRSAPAPGVAFGFSLTFRPWIARYDVYGSPASGIRRATLRPKTSNLARPD